MRTPNTRMARQSARRAELDTIRLARPLTAAEAAEADNLAHRLYMREWHKAFGKYVADPRPTVARHG